MLVTPEHPEALSVPEPLDVHVEMAGGDVPTQVDRLTLRGPDGSFGGFVEFRPNAAGIELEPDAPPG